MKTTFKRGICLFICLIMCLTALISCKDKNNDESNEGMTNDQHDGTAFSTVRRENYGEYDFSILPLFRACDGNIPWNFWNAFAKLSGLS